MVISYALYTRRWTLFACHNINNRLLCTRIYVYFSDQHTSVSLNSNPTVVEGTSENGCGGALRKFPRDCDRSKSTDVGRD